MTAHILITGGARGIGAAAANLLRNQGAKVVALSSQDGDLSDANAAPEIWARSLDQLDGHIDILINNAGIFDANPIEREQDAWLTCWNKTMQVNLTSTAQLSRLAILHWQSRGCAGRIINVASRARSPHL